MANPRSAIILLVALIVAILSPMLSSLKPDDMSPSFTSVCSFTDIDRSNKFQWIVPQSCSQLILSNNYLSDGEVAMIFEALLRQPAVSTSETRVGFNAQQQQQHMVQLSLLDLSWNLMSSEATKGLTRFIASSTSIEYLYLGYNPLNEVQNFFLELFQFNHVGFHDLYEYIRCTLSK